MREVKGPVKMKAKHTCSLSHTVVFKHGPTSIPGAASSFPGPQGVDSGNKGGCYECTRSEGQGKGRATDKLSGVWEWFQAEAYVPPLCFSPAESWSFEGLPSSGLRPWAEGRTR